MMDTESIKMIPEKEPGSFRLVATLGLAGLFSGIILVSTFIYTSPLIKANKEAAIQRAIFKVLPACSSYTTLNWEAGKLAEKVAVADGKEEAGQDELLIYAGYNSSEELIGFAVPGSEPGFQDVISAIFGYDDTRKTIIGFEVVESRETPGLGDKILKDADFQANFTALAVEPEIVPVKKGQQQHPNEVETITGATISSKAVVRLLNKSMAVWQTAIDDYIRENNLRISQHHE